jgi:hypothetical protein
MRVSPPRAPGCRRAQQPRGGCPLSPFAQLVGARLISRGAHLSWVKSNRTLSASVRNYGDISPVPRAATPNLSVGYPTPNASSMPAHPFPGSVRSGSEPPGRGRARRVPIPGMGVARRLGAARGTWTYTANVYAIEFMSRVLSRGHQSLHPTPIPAPTLSGGYPKPAPPLSRVARGGGAPGDPGVPWCCS